MVQKVLYNADEVKAMMETHSVILVDVRDQEFFEASHIEGAVNIPDVFYFLSTSSVEGIESLQETFQKHFSEAGISNDKMVIFYEDSLTKRYCGSCRGYWISRYLGHDQAGILYGGMDHWIVKGYSIASGKVEPVPAQFEVHPSSFLMATKDDVKNALADSSVKLLDDRDREEWEGASSSPYGVDYAPRKGRIPGAKWIEWREFMEVVGEYPAFKSQEAILALCAEQDLYPEDDIIIYCFKGSRASNTYVALKLAGFEKLRIYFASWNEWSRDPDLPIEETFPSGIETDE